MYNKSQNNINIKRILYIIPNIRDNEKKNSKGLHHIL